MKYCRGSACTNWLRRGRLSRYVLSRLVVGIVVVSSVSVHVYSYNMSLSLYLSLSLSLSLSLTPVSCVIACLLVVMVSTMHAYAVFSLFSEEHKFCCTYLHSICELSNFCIIMSISTCCIGWRLTVHSCRVVMHKETIAEWMFCLSLFLSSLHYDGCGKPVWCVHLSPFIYTCVSACFL